MIDRPASILCIVVDKLEINVDLSAATVWIPSKLFREFTRQKYGRLSLQIQTRVSLRSLYIIVIAVVN